MNSDRNLLLGLLALQLNFVDRQQLVTAFDHWVTDKARSLGQIFLEQRALAADEHALLEALAAKHVERHGNDPQKSLADLSAVGSARDELRRLADEDLQASLAHVSAARGDDENELPSTLSFAVGASSSAGTRFRVLRPHARGGLGEVYLAIDEELHREVALKEIQKHRANDPVNRARFLLEAEITGGLEHPGIVPVYGLGSYADGRPFYAMRFIRGDSLKEAIERFHKAETPSRDPGERELGLRNLLGRLIDVCNAIEYAHSRGVLHRDLKPGNIMLGKYGETLVVDWGLAKVVGRHDRHAIGEESTFHPMVGSGSAPTETGRAVGTPQFMSPEQAEGRIDKLGPHSDVYSLGATLYTLLTGRPPFAKDDTGNIVERVSRGEFPKPRQVKSDISPGLEAICLKAMALAAASRYKSPQALASDLEHWLADEPVSALQDTFVERAARWIRRHQALARSAAAALLTISVVSISAALVVDQARRGQQIARQMADKEKEKALLAEHNAEEAAQRERTQRLEAERHSRIATSLRLATQSQAIRKELPVQSLLLAVESLNIANQRNEKPLLEGVQALWDGLSTIGGRPFFGHSMSLHAVTMSADGRWLATSSADSSRLWDLKAGTGDAAQLLVVDHTSWARRAVFSDNSHWLATFGEKTRLWNLTTHTPNAKPIEFPPCYDIGNDDLIAPFSPDGRWLVTRSNSGRESLLWDLNAVGTPPTELPHDPNDWITTFSPDSQWLAFVSRNGTKPLLLWNLQLAPMANPVELDVAPHRSFAFSPTAKWLAVNNVDAIRLWNLEAGATRTPSYELRGNAHFIDFEFTTDGRWLITSEFNDPNVRLWDLAAGDKPTSVDVLVGSEQGLDNLRSSPDGRWIAGVCHTGVADSADTLWLLSLSEATPPQRAISLGKHELHVGEIKFSADCRWLATTDKSIARLWDLHAPDIRASLIIPHGHEGRVTSICFSPDARLLVTGSADTSARLWELGGGAPTATPVALHTASPVEEVAISSDGKWLASFTKNDGISIWHLESEDSYARPTLLPHGSSTQYKAVALSADGRYLAAADADGIVRLWNLSRKEQDAPLVMRGPPAPLSLAFSPDGRWLGVTTMDGTMWLWNLTGDEPYSHHKLQPHSGVIVFSFASNGRWLATGSSDYGSEITDNPVWLWDLTGRNPEVKPFRLQGHEDPIHALQFSPNGRWLASGSRDYSVRLWDLAVGAPGTQSVILRGHGARVYSVAFSMDGRWMATSSTDGTTRLWDLYESDTAIRSILLGSSKVALHQFKFSPDSSWLFTTGDEGIRFWNLRKTPLIGELAALPGHEGAASALAVTSESHWFAASSPNKTMGLWDLTAADPVGALVALRSQGGIVSGMSSVASDRWLATYPRVHELRHESEDSAIRLWHLRLNEMIELARRTAGRELSADERHRYLIAEARVSPSQDQTPMGRLKSAVVADRPVRLKIDQVLPSARIALSERRLSDATNLIESADTASAPTSAVVELGRVRVLTNYVARFWRAARNTLTRPEVADTIILNGTRIAVIESDENHLVIRVESKRREYQWQKIPRALAYHLADKGLKHNDRTRELSLAAFEIVDPQGDRSVAQQLLESVESANHDAKPLLEELKLRVNWQGGNIK